MSHDDDASRRRLTWALAGALVVVLAGCGSAETADVVGTSGAPTTTIKAPSKRSQDLASLNTELTSAGFDTALPAFRDSLARMSDSAGGEDWPAAQDAARNVIATGAAVYSMLVDAPVGPNAVADVVAFSVVVNDAVEAVEPLLLCSSSSECDGDLEPALSATEKADAATQRFAEMLR